MEFSDTEKQQLLKLARQSIEHGLKTGKALKVDDSQWPDSVKVQAACFVTLNINSQLRGCIGHLSAIQPLVDDVAENAYSAAFRDPRFQPLSEDELDTIHIDISVLTPPEKISFSDEDDLLSQIEPDVDGLILKDGFRQGTFLPSVWEQLPDKNDFWRHLKLKAGLAPDHWSDTLEVSRYRALAISE